MKEYFINTLEELEQLQCEYDLDDYGMSGLYSGYHWFQDDAQEVTVYFKLEG